MTLGCIPLGVDRVERCDGHLAVVVETQLAGVEESVLAQVLVDDQRYNWHLHTMVTCVNITLMHRHMLIYHAIEAESNPVT